MFRFGPSSNGLRKPNVPLLVYYGILCRNDLSSQTGNFLQGIFLARAVPSVRLYVGAAKISASKVISHQSSWLGIVSAPALLGRLEMKNKTTMPSTKEDGTATAAAEQLGSVSLGESGERKDNGAKNNEGENEVPTKMCSACGKKSDALKKCNGCKCVWYCDKKCQNKHRKEHRKECKVIMKELDKRGGKLDLGEELDIGPLGKLPPREGCPICMHALPIHPMLSAYSNCCGKTVCGSCDYQHKMKTGEENEKRAQKKQPTVPRTCEFCREPVPEQEILAPLRKRVELKDPEALFNIALHYGEGGLGLQVDQVKCIELLRESADLGFPDAQYQLGNYYDDGEMGLERNEAEALKYWKKAAEGGDLDARHNLGGIEFRSDNHLAAMRHWRLAASGGFKKSMGALILCFEDGFLRHDDLAETNRAFYRSRAEMKSEGRDQYIKHLKETGQYGAGYDL